MLGDNIDPKVKNTYLLLFGVIVYLVVISFFLLFLKRESITQIDLIFALSLIPLLAIFVMVWGYGLKFKMPGLELEYYPVEKVMKPPSVIKEMTSLNDAEEKMEKDGIDFLNILDNDGIFKGILTKSDIIKARRKNRMNRAVENFMTKRENVISATEREGLTSIMRKIGESKHSRLPIIDKNNRVMGIVDSVDINDLISRI